MASRQTVATNIAPWVAPLPPASKAGGRAPVAPARPHHGATRIHRAHQAGAPWCMVHRKLQFGAPIPPLSRPTGHRRGFACLSLSRIFATTGAQTDTYPNIHNITTHNTEFQNKVLVFLDKFVVLSGTSICSSGWHPATPRGAPNTLKEPN